MTKDMVTLHASLEASSVTVRRRPINPGAPANRTSLDGKQTELVHEKSVWLSVLSDFGLRRFLRRLFPQNESGKGIAAVQIRPTGIIGISGKSFHLTRRLNDKEEDGMPRGIEVWECNVGGVGCWQAA
jgi:hypothetical protein